MPCPPSFPSYWISTHPLGSEKTDEIRTIQKFSTEAQEKLTGEPFFDIWAAYWETPDYADVFTTSACQGTGDFADTSFPMRSESCLKGAQ